MNNKRVAIGKPNIFLLLCFYLFAFSSNAQENFINIAVAVSDQDGNGIPSITLSDGNYFYQTDSSGSVDFQTDSEFVFLIYPAGYTFNLLENGSVDYYKRVDKENSKQQISFKLTALAESDQSHAFIAIADPQLLNEAEADEFLNESAPNIKQAAADLSNVFGVAVGDLVFDRFDLYPRYNEAIKATGIPFFQVLGNHDIDLEGASNEASQYPFKEQYGPSYYAFNRGDVHYIVLNDVFFMGQHQYYGHLPEQQQRWLERDLATVPKEMKVVIFLHIPSVTQVVEFNPGRDINKESLINKSALFDLLEGREVHLISGHVHWNENTQITDQIFEHNTGAISGAWWSGNICYDGTPRGFGVYQADGDSLIWYYQSIDKPKSYQFRSYPLGHHADFPDKVAINIWNYDPAWQVSWYEDGVKVGTPEAIIAVDPLAVETFTGENKQSKHEWISPQKNGHMFFFSPQNQDSAIEIEVIDRFGTIYREKL